jgi:hypothetical protein
LRFLVIVAGRFVGHGDAFGGAGFVDDAFEEAADGGIGERALIVGLRVGEYFGFARGLVERNFCFVFEVADFEGAFAALVEELDEFFVDFVHAAAPVGDVHVLPPEEQEVEEAQEDKEVKERRRAVTFLSEVGIMWCWPRGGRGRGGRLLLVFGCDRAGQWPRHLMRGRFQFRRPGQSLLRRRPLGRRGH